MLHRDIRRKLRNITVANCLVHKKLVKIVGKNVIIEKKEEIIDW